MFHTEYSEESNCENKDSYQLMKANADDPDCCVLSLLGKSEGSYLLVRMELYIIGSCLSDNFCFLTYFHF